ncbi:MAG: ATP-binding protein, partial [Pseudomonadota bacterium]
MDRIDAFNTVITSLPMPALIIGRGKRVLCMNGAACELLGHDGTGTHYTAVLRQPGAIEAIEASLADQRSREARHIGREGDRDLRYRVDISPLAGAPGSGVLVVFDDISDAEGLGQMRRDFVANVSHELRTPLTALMGFIETLRGPAREDPVATERFLGMMELEAERMNRLVHDLLSLSRLESEERMRPDKKVDLILVIRETADMLHHALGDQAAALELDLPRGPIWVSGDRDQLMQVLRNLVENAIKYGAQAVTVSMSLPEREPALRGPAAVIDVRDDGEGIEAHHLPRLTERFYRVDAHRSRANGGTGLGLAIVKHVVGRHRGRLRISSVRGEGSTF